MIATALLRSWLRRAALGGVAARLGRPGLRRRRRRFGLGLAQSSGLANAKKALLVKSDFPSGWTGQGSVTTERELEQFLPRRKPVGVVSRRPPRVVEREHPVGHQPDLPEPGRDPVRPG